MLCAELQECVSGVCLVRFSVWIRVFLWWTCRTLASTACPTCTRWTTCSTRPGLSGWLRAAGRGSSEGRRACLGRLQHVGRFASESLGRLDHGLAVPGGCHARAPVLPEPSVPPGVRRAAVPHPPAAAAAARAGERTRAVLRSQRLLPQRGSVGAACTEQPGAAQHRALAQLQRRLHAPQPGRLRPQTAVAAGAGDPTRSHLTTEHSIHQCWGKLLLKVMRYNIALLPKKSNYVT